MTLTVHSTVLYAINRFWALYVVSMSCLAGCAADQTARHVDRVAVNPQRASWASLVDAEIEVTGKLAFPFKVLPGEMHTQDVAEVVAGDCRYRLHGKDVRSLEEGTVVIACGTLRKLHKSKEEMPVAQQGVAGVDFDLFYIDVITMEAVSTK